jgi:hypothetical protein
MEHLTVAEVRVRENGEADFYTIARDTGAGAWISESELREMCTRGWE